MTIDPLLPDEPKEAPHYQRFVAFSVLLPVEKGKRVYHRVIISGTHKDLEQDLGELLPKQIRRLLSHSDSEEIWERTKRRVKTTTPNREDYFAFCSCKTADCEHIQDAVEHFFLIQDFAENSGQIIRGIRDNRVRVQEYSQGIDAANSTLQTLTTKLDGLERERSELANRLQRAREEDEKLALSLMEELDDKGQHISILQDLEATTRSEKEALLFEKQGLETANRILRGNLEAIGREFGKLAAEKHTSTEKGLSDEVIGVVSEYFALEPSNLEPESKLAPSIFSDHHKASNVETLARRLSAIDFVKYVGASYRREAKHNKVVIMPLEHELEVIIADGDNANILKLGTTAQTRPQQLLAAHLVAKQFDARVELK
jgi:predicted  nucleic acid-binding Zn-ribbon protein